MERREDVNETAHGSAVGVGLCQLGRAGRRKVMAVKSEARCLVNDCAQ